jgi:sodium/proline symporter
MSFAIAFAVYTLAIVAVGVWSARYARRNNEDYFLAGRSLGPWVAALSASASSESGWVTLGLVGTAFVTGWSAYWILPGCLLGFLFNWFVIAGRMRDHSARVGAVTLPDFFAQTFAERVPVLRILTVIVIFTAMWLYVAAQFAAAGKAFEAAFDVRYQIGVVLGAAIVLLYTVVGGFRAACWTDFVQGVVMVGTLVVFPLWLVYDRGGFEAIRETVAPVGDAYLTFWPQKTGAVLLGFLLSGGALGVNFGYPGQPHILVRFMALRERRHAIVGGIVSFVWGALVLFGAVTVGIVVRAFTVQGAEWTIPLQEQIATNATGAGETGLVLAALNLIPGVFSGMVLAAVLAAICSTADSQLVVAASAGANDIYARLFGGAGERSQMLINRLVLLVLGVGAFALVLDREVSVFAFVLTYGWAVLGAALGPQVILVLLWRRASYAGCVAGMVTGFATALIWPRVYAPEGDDAVVIYNLPLAFCLALVVNILVSLLGPARRST